MRKDSGRRAFIKNIGISGLSATILPVAGFANSTDGQKHGDENKKSASRQKDRSYNTTYKNEHLNRIAFPVGGMGAGMFCMEGTGSISHVSVRNKPEIFNEPGIFAAISLKGKKMVLNCWRVLYRIGKNLAREMLEMGWEVRLQDCRIFVKLPLMQNFHLLIST